MGPPFSASVASSDPNTNVEGGGGGVEALGPELLATWFILAEPKGLFEAKADGGDTTLNRELEGLSVDPASESILFF